MKAPVRVAWQEKGGRRIIADKVLGGEWEFSDQYSGEARWFALEPTPALIAVADQLLAEQGETVDAYSLAIHALSYPVPLYCRPRP